MTIKHKDQINKILDQKCEISEISIIHRTGRPRVICNNGNVFDIGFDDLIEILKDHTYLFNHDLLVKYCAFSVKQVNRLIDNIPYRINSKKFKDKEFGFFELHLSYAKDKKMKVITL